MKLSWLEHSGICTEADLDAAGVLHERLPLSAERYEPAIAELSAKRGYVARDQVELSPATPNLQGLLARFLPEHLHTDDEVRFVLEGEGIFDIRSVEDRWMRVVVEAGDLLVVPAGRNHRFLLTELQRIRCVRLFKDQSGWAPVYRQASAGAA